MKSKHIYLNLFFIDFPLTAITSILHRITGVILFLSMPVVLYFLKLSLVSDNSFVVVKILISSYFYIKFFMFIFCSSFIYHMFCGIKHMIIDVGLFDSRSASRRMSLFFLLVSMFFIILMGIII